MSVFTILFSLQIYLVPIAGGQSPKHLTSGKQGATDNPAFNAQGTKIAWTEMAEDGNESDRYVEEWLRKNNPLKTPLIGLRLSFTILRRMSNSR